MNSERAVFPDPEKPQITQITQIDVRNRNLPNLRNLRFKSELRNRRLNSGKKSATRAGLVSAGCVLLTALLAGFSGCSLNDGILARTQEYFPLADSTQWVYQHEDFTTSEVFVRGESSAFEHACTVVEEDAAEQYWFKGEGEVRKFVDYSINIGGTDYPLEQSYRRYLVLPLVLGNSWSEDFSARVPVLGDTIAFGHRIEGRVADISTVEIPYGKLTQCYEVDLTETVTQDSAPTTVQTQEWYAPGIGLVKRVQGNATEELVSFQNGQ